MEKIMEIGHNKQFDELKPKLLEKIESLRNQYSQEIASYGVQCFWNEEKDVLIVNYSKYSINWYTVFIPNIIQIYEEAPPHIKPFLLSYRGQFMDIIRNELQEIISENNCKKEVEPK